MPSYCAVPNCRSWKYKGVKKPSTFQVPNDETLRKKWIDSIPSVNSLRLSQRICEKHFEKHLVIKEYIKYDGSGKLIAQVPLSHARLQKGAVPTVFEQMETYRSRSPIRVISYNEDHTYAFLESSSHAISKMEVENQSASTTAQKDPDENASSQQLLCTMIDILQDGELKDLSSDSLQSDIDLEHDSVNMTNFNPTQLEHVHTSTASDNNTNVDSHSTATNELTNDNSDILQSESLAACDGVQVDGDVCRAPEYVWTDITFHSNITFSLKSISSSHAISKMEVENQSTSTNAQKYSDENASSQQLLCTTIDILQDEELKDLSSDSLQSDIDLENDSVNMTNFNPTQLEHVHISTASDNNTNVDSHSTTKNELTNDNSDILQSESLSVCDGVQEDGDVCRAPECVRTDITFDSNITFSLKSLSNNSLKGNLFIKVPKPWSVSKITIGSEENLLFSCIAQINDCGTMKHILEKAIIIKPSREMIYEVYSTPVDVTRMKLPQVLEVGSMLPEILKKFKDLRICKGITTIDYNYIQENAALKRDICSNFRHKDCSILSINRERCCVCKKYSKGLSQNIKRMKSTKNMKRISISANPLDQMKLKALKKKMKFRAVTAKRLKYKLALLTESIGNQQSKVAKIADDVYEKISNNQKTVVKEIISCAQKSDPRGRRYSDEFIMLCMLMNIRSPSYYEFLRKNDIIPLPCSKTVRDYLSSVGTKCGFDEDFFKLLKKSFGAKDIRKRHGVLLLDEINLRKSVAVSAKTLTYSGLTDFGDDGPQSSNIEDVATHGLVLQFQSLTDNYTQPIAVFASKNSVDGKQLAKLVIKAICLLENAGAFIHGIIGDGATTNRKMFKILGVNGTISALQTSFVHPLDNNRQVFAFSDTPHLFKCIRNRLHNKGRLKVNPDGNYIKWEYFKHLYDIDNSNPGNARVCPKISRRHIELDNSAKMRVRFATQIFSNSVAAGLRFYSLQKIKQFEGCEETITFCLRMNNMFDALNRKQPNEGLHPESTDFKLLQEAIKWLNKWETDKINGLILQDEFLTQETAHGLRITITPTLDLCKYLIDKYDFRYLLTGKVNQDNLEKFFGIIRGAAGSNEHPTCPTFLSLYKLLSVYSIIKPPKFGNCTVSERPSENVITIEDLKNIYKKSQSKTSAALEKLKNRIDNIIRHEDWEADEVIEHDYTLAPVLDCIIYYVTGYLCKQVLKCEEYKNCQLCKEALTNCEIGSSVGQLVDLKTRGGLIHANSHFFSLINFVEKCFSKYAHNSQVLDLTVDEVSKNYEFSFPCREHGSDILSYSIFYYIRLRMRQFTYQENKKIKQKSVVQRKLSKLTNV